VIAKEEQLQNVEIPQPTDQLLAETHTLHNAELTHNVTLFNQEHAQRTVTITLNVPLILAI
jgi:hypothetical protein